MQAKRWNRGALRCRSAWVRRLGAWRWMGVGLQVGGGNTSTCPLARYTLSDMVHAKDEKQRIFRAAARGSKGHHWGPGKALGLTQWVNLGRGTRRTAAARLQARGAAAAYAHVTPSCQCAGG